MNAVNTTPDEVRRIVALDDEPVLRNLLITQGYRDLSDSVRARTGGGTINWCTLGTWASKTAGEFIRTDEVPAAFRAVLDRGNVLGKIAHALDPVHLLDLVERIVADTSTYILVGNRVVFAELALAFADFMATLGADTTYDADKLKRFQATFTDGMPEPDVATWNDRTLEITQRGGQRMMRSMVGALYAAMFETDAKKRDELLLLANAYGGVHEQTRLQTYIAGSLDAPITETLLRGAHDHVDAKVEHASLRSVAHSLVDSLGPAIAKRIEASWESFATISMMTLTLPDGLLHLGTPIPSAPGEPIVPPTLETIENPELRTVLGEYGALDVKIEQPPLERVVGRFETLLGLGHPVSSVLVAGAVDWVDLQQRMRYILALFRSRADDDRLFAQPFSHTQRTELAAGRMPTGPF